ncbi:MAG: 50S ribosomal protein L22 [Alphaproteobacteria bacterium]|nr:50S ribosomal protein L22 [Alphaproteobacteria bacterium]
MGKPSRERALPDTEAKAVARNLRISPQKLNLVAGLIRGKPVEQALADLEFSRKRISDDVRKCLMSAIANAENNHQLSIDQLVVAEAYVGKNLIMKRFHARGRGRSSVVIKPFSQITVVVREVNEEELENSRKRGNGGKVKAAKASRDGRGVEAAVEAD